MERLNLASHEEYSAKKIRSIGEDREADRAVGNLPVV